MRHPLITGKIYREPWCITADKHADIRRAFENHVKSGHSLDTAAELVGDDMPDSVGSVAVVPVFGIIGKHLSMIETACGGVDLNSIAAALSVAVADETAEVVVLHFNSPGGTVTGVPELAERIKRAAEEKPVIAYTDGQMCSAAYWLASQCSAIYASQSADVGSIGVYLALLDESAALAQQGVKVNLIKAGRLKAAGAPFQPLTDDERAMFQRDVDKIYAKFTAAVRAGRGDLADDLLQGQSFDGEDAARLGLTDGVVDSFEELLDLTTAH